jgi:hypothetical protein
LSQELPATVHSLKQKEVYITMYPKYMSSHPRKTPTKQETKRLSMHRKEIPERRKESMVSIKFKRPFS